MIGVVDYEKQKHKRFSYSSNNAMCYHGYNGRKYPNEVNEGQGGGFKEGDIVEVDVDRASSTIRYSVNRIVRATHTHEMLADNSRVFMPFVDMYNTDDIVEWVIE